MAGYDKKLNATEAVHRSVNIQILKLYQDLRKITDRFARELYFF